MKTSLIIVIANAVLGMYAMEEQPLEEFKGRYAHWATLKGHKDSVFAVAPLETHKLASGSQDKTIKVWDINTKECVRTFKGHSSGVGTLVCVDDLIISGATDQTIKIWDTKSGKEAATLEGHVGTVTCLAVHNQKIVSGSKDSTVKMWKIETLTCYRTLENSDAMQVVQAVALHKKHVIVGSMKNKIPIFDRKLRTNKKPIAILIDSEAAATCFQVDPKTEHIIYGVTNKIKIWDQSACSYVKTLTGHKSKVKSIFLDNNEIISASWDKTIKIWDKTTGKEVQTLEAHDSFVNSVTKQAGCIISASSDNTIKIWRETAGLEL